MSSDNWPRTDPESAAALRAYLQRCEVRLSTVHRVASALLSGAGLVVLFPALAKDSVARIVRALFEGPSDAPHRLVLVGVLSAAALPVIALWQLLRDLVRFYFAGQHFDDDNNREFFPRFALSGLRPSPTDVDQETWREIEAAHHDPNVRAFLLPENQSSRNHVDDQMRRYRLRGYDSNTNGLSEEQRDEQRRLALLDLAATGTRTLPQQAARLEQVLARHVLNIQILVLRYAKAVLAMLTTAVAAFAATAVIDHDPTLTNTTMLWLAAIITLWSPLIILAVTAPLEWIISYAKADNASDSALNADPQFSSFEDTTVRIAVFAWVAATAATLIHASRTNSALAPSLAAIGLSIGGLILAFARWDGRRSLLRLVKRPQ
jgi:hypothetical protein